MTEEQNSIVDNITEPSAWTRVLLMIVFAIASYFVLLPLILMLSIAQVLFTLITGKVNANLRYFSAVLELYFSQLFKFMTYLSEVKPYPFSDLPEVEDDSLEVKSAPKKTSKKANGNAKDDVKTSATSTVAATPAAKNKAVSQKAAEKKAPENTEKSEKDAGGDGVSDS